MATNDEKILKELQNISFLLGDLNNIRHGEYDPPRGADPDSKHIWATPDDIFHTLSSIVGLLERQNTMIYNLGKVVCESNEAGENYWRDLNSR